jgi:hypothetical protein
MDEKFEYFMKRTEQDLDHIRTRVDKLWDFRLMLLGGSAVVSIISAAIFEIVLALMGHK